MVRKLQDSYEQRSLIINKRQSEYMIFGNNEKEDPPLENDYTSREDKCKHFGVVFTKSGNSNEKNEQQSKQT
jgi:hypothetical protein